MGKTIVIRLHPDGSVTGETHGAKGKECLAYMSLLEELMHASVVDSEFTDEFFAEESVEVETDVTMERDLA